MARVAAVKVEATRTSILDAAGSVLRERGYASLSTREVAAAAGVPLSQIHYHFGSKQGMVLALFEYMNARLLDRQNAMFADPGLTLSEQWDLACDYLDDDLATGYVRVLQELLAAISQFEDGAQGDAGDHQDAAQERPEGRHLVDEEPDPDRADCELQQHEQGHLGGHQVTRGDHEHTVGQAREHAAPEEAQQQVVQ